MSLLRRYSGNSQASTPRGLEERTDYDEDRSAAVFRPVSRSHSLRRPSPMPTSPRSSFSSPSSSPRAPPSRRTSGNWSSADGVHIEDTIAEEPESLPASSWSSKVDAALHNLPYEHDATSYRSGAFVPQHVVAGQTYNYRRLDPATGGPVIKTIVEDAPSTSQ